MKTRWMSALALTGAFVVAGCCCLCGGSRDKACSEPKATGLTTDQLVSPANIGETPTFS